MLAALLCRHGAILARAILARATLARAILARAILAQAILQHGGFCNMHILPLLIPRYLQVPGIEPETFSVLG